MPKNKETNKRKVESESSDGYGSENDE